MNRNAENQLRRKIFDAICQYHSSSMFATGYHTMPFHIILTKKKKKNHAPTFIQQWHTSAKNEIPKDLKINKHLEQEKSVHFSHEKDAWLPIIKMQMTVMKF